MPNNEVPFQNTENWVEVEREVRDKERKYGKELEEKKGINENQL